MTPDYQNALSSDDYRSITSITKNYALLFWQRLPYTASLAIPSQTNWRLGIWNSVDTTLHQASFSISQKANSSPWYGYAGITGPVTTVRPAHGLPDAARPGGALSDAWEAVMHNLASRELLLIFFFALCVFLSGCGDKNDTATLSQASVNADTPFAPTLRLLGEIPSANNKSLNKKLKLDAGGVGGGLISWAIHTVVDGLQEGITIGIANATTGRLFDGLNSDSGTNAQYTAILGQLTNITTQLSSVSSQITALSQSLNLQNDAILNTINNTQLYQIYTPIQTAFNSGSSSYTYIASAAAKSPPIPTATLTGMVSKFTTDPNNSNSTMNSHIRGLYNLVIHQGVLHTYAKEIIDQNATTLITTQADATTLAENAYTLLQQKFGEILVHQLEAEIIIIEMDNALDPNGLAGYAAADLKAFYQVLQEETNAFIKEVNFLMINLVDYRYAAKYNSDISNVTGKTVNYMHDYGLAPDKTYSMVYATSRIFVAQLLNNIPASYGIPKDTGFHGVIILPKLYALQPGSSSSPVTPGPITVKFKGYTNNPSTNQPVFTGYSTSIKVPQPTTVSGQFPYTAWTNSTSPPQSYPDNQWLFYEFTAASDFPAGYYQMYLVDDGNKPSNSPWHHTQTFYGNLNVLWYDATTHVGPGSGTLSPASSNSYKFGMFAARWDWGYNLLAMDQWNTPARITKLYGSLTAFSSPPSPVSVGNPCYPGTSNYNVLWPWQKLSGFEFYPEATNQTTNNNVIGVYLPQQNKAYFSLATLKQFPFALSSTVTPNVISNTGAQLFYSIVGTGPVNNIQYSDEYDIVNTSTNSAPTVMDYHDMDSSGKQTNVNITNSGTFALIKGNAYRVSANAMLYSNWIFATDRSATIKFSSDMQVVYTGTYPLPTPLY